MDVPRNPGAHTMDTKDRMTKAATTDGKEAVVPGGRDLNKAL